MKNSHLYILSAILAAIGIGLFTYKAFFLELPLRPNERTENWEIQAKIKFDARDGPVKLALFIPKNEGPFTIVDQSFVSEGYGLTTASKGVNRRALFSILKASGPQTIYYRLIVNRARLREHRVEEEVPEVDAPRLGEARAVAARGIIKSLRPQAADDDTFVRLLLKSLLAENLDKNAATLLGLAPRMSNRVHAATRILALTGIPSRTVTGVQLTKSNTNAGWTYWLEAYVNGRWHGYAPQTDTLDVPRHYFPWRRGPGTTATIEGGMFVNTTLSVAAASEPALRTALIVSQSKERSLLNFSLFTLPLDTQQVYKIILTVPLGVLFLTVLRNVVGLRTFGTFMPILIALAFRETLVVWGVVLFTVVTAIGLLIRLYLENLRLLVVPRLSSVLIVVVLIMAGISVLSNQLGFERGLSVSLFPMVILTMTVERMSIVWDERGPMEMLRLGISSLIVAIFAYFIMINAYAEHIVLVFPELLLVLLAINLLLGRYSGFRLLDLPRFRVLAGNTS